MTREETANKATPLWGNKLYHERARAALPLLVRQAKAGASITYGSLAKELGIPNPRNLNYPLGSIGASLQHLGKEWQRDIPPIQVLVINKNTGLPGAGIGWFLHHPKADFARLSRQQKDELVKVAHFDIYAYRHWDEVLRALELKPVFSNAEALVKTATRFKGGGEGEAHRRLKTYVCAHPELIDFRHPCQATVERRLPSGDALDVSFESRRHWTAVEVKSAVSAEGDLERGLFQCVKYKAVMAAECAVQGKRKDVDALLVVEGKLSPDLLALANTLGIQFAEVSRHGNTYQCG